MAQKFISLFVDSIINTIGHRYHAVMTLIVYAKKAGKMET